MLDYEQWKRGATLLRPDLGGVREEQFIGFIHAPSLETRQQIWRWLQRNQHTRSAQMYFKAAQLAEQLSRKYKVIVQVVRTDDLYYSEDQIGETILSGIFVVSAESPEVTAKTTEMLIQFGAEKDRIVQEEKQNRKLDLLDMANLQRTINSAQTTKEVAPVIAELIQKHKDENNGKEPSLHKLADLLNKNGAVAPGGPGSKWYAQSVKRVMTAANKQERH